MFLKLSNFFERVSKHIARSLMWIVLVLILAMMVLTVSDVCGRYFLKEPIRGAFEITEFMLILTVASGLAYTQVTKRHIFVEFMVSRLGLRIRRVTQGIGYIICLGIYVLITWQGVRGGLNQWRNMVTSGAFSIPLWPFYFFLAFGCSILCLIFLTDLLKLLDGKGNGVP
jgi:TRAP-type C4-dicarboxylate transport system permease small subunit